MWKSRVLQGLTVLLAVAALVICFMLLRKHLTGSSGFAWFEAGCPVDATKSTASCAAVLQSPYSYWPHKKPTTPGAAPAGRGYPVAFLGMVYYSVLIVWFLGVGRPSFARRWLHLVPLILIGLGLIGSAYFMYVMFAKLDDWCPWCLATHILNALIAGCVILLWSRAAKDEPTSAEEKPVLPPRGARESLERRAPAALNAAGPSHPSWRLVLITLLAMIVTALGEQQLMGRFDAVLDQASIRSEVSALREMIRQIQGDPNRLLRVWDVGEQRNLSIRPDDPVRFFAKPDQKPFLDFVIFSDMECPSCKLTEEFLEKQVQPLFGGRIRVIFKHFPLDPTCNAQASHALHKNACKAAKIAEAARLQGDADAFWRAHDLLFTRQKPPPVGLDGVDPKEIAKTLGLDANRLVADMELPTIAQRITEDVNEAKRLEIRRTPFIFVHGKEVDSIAVKVLGFWDALADSYWGSIDTPRPETTRMKTAPPTPSSPGSTGAP